MHADCGATTKISVGPDVVDVRNEESIVPFGLLSIMRCKRRPILDVSSEPYEFYFLSLHCIQALNFYNSIRL